MAEPPDPAPGARISLDGALNLRDLGGWRTAAGETVARGRLFRSDRLSDLTDRDHRTLAEFGITTVVDLRFRTEIESHPTKLWTGVTDHVEIPIGGEYVDQGSFIERALAGEFEAMTDADVGDMYITMLDTYANAIGETVETCLWGRPTLFHCTAGKDRTGLVAMLVLRTVGVAEADVLTDYGLSTRYRTESRIRDLEPTFAEHGLDIERFRAILSAPPAAMAAAMRWVDDHHGSPAGYLTGRAGVDDPERRLRALLLTAER